MMHYIGRSAIAFWWLALSIVIACGIGSSLSNSAVFEGIDYARIVSKTCLVMFLAMMGYLTLVRERPVAQAIGWQPRVSAFVGTNLLFISLIFLHQREDLGIGLHLISAGLILTGNALCLYVLSHLGRSFSVMAEARKLVTNGPYSVVRHPLYLAEEIAIIGIFIQYASPFTAVLFAVHFAFQMRRMLNVEKLLCRTLLGYEAYMTRTARLLPMTW
jgi:protein-S-isoprenylcysteine O-methyltransferase Ste14